MAVVTVDTETCFAAQSWTGVEASFSAGFKAEATADVVVYSRDDTTGIETELTDGIHHSVTLGVDGAVTVTPIALPAAPKTILMLRNTPALQGVAFQNLGDFDAAAHTVLHSRAALRDAEDKFHHDRGYRVPLGESGGLIAREDDRKGKLFGWNGTTGAFELYDPVPALAANQRLAAIVCVIDGGGLTIPSGVKLDLSVPFACEIQSAAMYADQVGSIVVDVWKDSHANFPPTVADSITASAKPTISADMKSFDGTLTGWTTAIAAGDVLRFNVNSASAIARVTLELNVERTLG